MYCREHSHTYTCFNNILNFSLNEVHMFAKVLFQSIEQFCLASRLRTAFKPVVRDLANWKGCPRPERKIFEGNYIRLEPLNAERHGDGLYEISSGPSGEERLQYLWEKVDRREEFEKWLRDMEKASDPIIYALVDKDTGKVQGRQSFWNIDEANGVVEIGHFLRDTAMEGKPGSLEATYLFLRYAFDELGYRRVAARTHHKNYASQKTILRYGLQLEGILRQHGVKKGKNQDSYFYSCLDKEWPFQKKVLELWLDPQNFDQDGKSKRRMEDVRTALMYECSLNLKK